MPEKPKPDCEDKESSEKCDEQSSWVKDQKKHEYYYDDAHGYEIYNADEEQENEDDIKPPASQNRRNKKEQEENQKSEQSYSFGAAISMSAEPVVTSLQARTENFRPGL